MIHGGFFIFVRTLEQFPRIVYQYGTSYRNPQQYAKETKLSTLGLTLRFK